jgi:hypothetical protein
MASLIYGRAGLDRMLAAGADPREDPKLGRRARKLTSPRFRAGLAAGIRNVVDAAEEPPRALSSQAPLARGEILHERALLLDLATDLCGDDEVSPRGVALVERLLADGASPIYLGGGAGTLRGAIVHARAALYMSRP